MRVSPPCRQVTFRRFPPSMRPIPDAAPLGQALKIWLHYAGISHDSLNAELRMMVPSDGALRATIDREPESAFKAVSPALLKQPSNHVGMPQPDEFARQASRVLAIAHAESLAQRELGSSN